MLDRDEYVEQAYFFRVLVERLVDNVPMQELFQSLQEEVLTTTKLPMAISFMLGELKLTGCFGTAMGKLSHYFTPFQTFVIDAAEREVGRFDMRVALNILRFLAELQAKNPNSSALFLYQFEVLCRNRLGYEAGLDAMSKDPAFTQDWSEWLQVVRRQIGILGLAEMIYVRSEEYLVQQAKRGLKDDRPQAAVLFGVKEGKISLANRRKEPLLLFAALQRHLDYPKVPKPEKADTENETIPLMIRRMERLENRIKLMEEEQQGGIDITQFYRQ